MLPATTRDTEERLVPTPLWLDRFELAGRFGVSPRTVETWRRTGFGPAGVRVGRRVRYRLVDVVAFEDSLSK